MIRSALVAFMRLMTFQLLFSEYRWYRRLYGGRWECHYIDVCASMLWLSMHPARCWPDYVQPCSRGTPIVEDWPGGPPLRLSSAGRTGRTPLA